MRLTSFTWRLCLIGLAAAASIPTRFPVPDNSGLGSREFSGPTFADYGLPSEKRAANDDDPDPLDSPGRRVTASKQRAFIQRLDKTITRENSLAIQPHETQLEGWKIDGISISATSEWKDWPRTKTTFRMAGLTGCTAIIIVNSHGFWQGHIWEAEGTAGKGGGFNELLANNQPKERTDDVFRKIAVDILDQSAPDIAFYESLADLKGGKGKKGATKNPLADSADTKVFILTKQKSKTDSSTLYSSKIEILKAKLRDYLPASPIVQKTYIGRDTDYDADSKPYKGEIYIQYTPWERDTCEKDRKKEPRKVAKAMVWYEDKEQAPIEKEWET
ncbi:uncharacterized protein JN550_003727 [Neoarthrinium moseri]|uniref:uncharacterized protein n=1 Tax=Neoarthrinium moseri TaxID=1658444 RepID=UPI001FDE375F|nr:uncharacterized protein JN550_003727 [Neoarthrinium moseri]KAI1872853.1 hypothetical protein JN550_003727 [Neoarthrinium moseri]